MDKATGPGQAVARALAEPMIWLVSTGPAGWFNIYAGGGAPAAALLCLEAALSFLSLPQASWAG